MEHLIESKTTTQHAPLELFLTYLRTRKILPFVNNSVVLDFGCGKHLRTLQAVEGRALNRYGLDSCFKSMQAHVTKCGIHVAGSFADLKAALGQCGDNINLILALACFEHFETDTLQGILRELALVSTSDATLVGTVPTPIAKPVLEFLSYKLRLIDPSQIRDHKVYYDRSTLEKALVGTGWELASYSRFQFGMNSFFKFKKAIPATLANKRAPSNEAP